MILTCPACSSRYLIDPAALGGKGRAVRCAGCHHRGVADPPDDAPRSTVSDPSAIASDESPVTRARTGLSGRLVGGLLLALVLLLAAAAVVGRNEVVASFPQAASIYQHLRLPVSVPLGLEFRDVISSRLEEGGPAGRVHLSGETWRRVRHRFDVEPHGTIEVEGKGRMETFLVLGTKTPSLHV